MISAIVLAAGLSTRMGRPKLVMPWGTTTVIGQVVTTFAQAGADEIVVVTGGAQVEVEAAVCGVTGATVRTVFNPRFAEDDMLVSLRAGMGVLGEEVQAMLVALGDQPQIEAAVIRSLLEAYHASHSPLIVPSYQMRRGHPWVVGHSLWPDLLSAPVGFTMRDFLNAHQQQITYIAVESSSILRDLDTPEDYERWKTGL